MTAIVLYPLLCAAAYYLGARAVITEWLWSRYPAWLDAWASCAACSGFWYGLGCAGLGWALDLPFLGLGARAWSTVPLVGLSALVWTPLVSALLISALERLGAPPLGTPLLGALLRGEQIDPGPHPGSSIPRGGGSMLFAVDDQGGGDAE